MKPDAAAGHSLGEFSALVVAGALSFEDGLKLVSKRAMAMQAACEAQPGTMAAILGLEDHVVEEICASVDGIVVAANYNCPGQLVDLGCRGSRRRSLRKSQGRRCAPRPAPARRRRIPLAADGACQAGTGKGDQRGSVPDARMPDLPECRREALHGSRTDQGQPDRTADRPGTLDIHRKEHACGWRDEFTELGPGNVLQGLIKK